MMWSFAWKNLISRPSRTVLAILGLTIPVLAFLGVVQHLGGDSPPDGRYLGGHE